MNSSSLFARFWARTISQMQDTTSCTLRGPRLHSDPLTDRLRVDIADPGVIRQPREPGSEANSKGDAKDHYLFIGDEINNRMRCNNQFAGLKLIRDAGAK